MKNFLEVSGIASVRILDKIKETNKDFYLKHQTLHACIGLVIFTIICSIFIIFPSK